MQRCDDLRSSAVGQTLIRKPSIKNGRLLALQIHARKWTQRSTHGFRLSTIANDKSCDCSKSCFLASITARVSVQVPLQSDRNSFDDVSGDGLVTAVVQSSGSGIGMTSQVLHFFKRNALTQQICYCRNSKRMWGQSQRQAAGFHAAFDHAANISSGHGDER
jgi:hypothetical protein